MKEWIKNRLDYYKILLNTDSLYSKIQDMGEMISFFRSFHSKMLFFGNGASNTIATHAALDFTNQLDIPCLAFNDSSVITAYANVFGYENSMKRFVHLYGRYEDCYVFISSSGESENIINAAEYVKSNGSRIITFTGFDKNNSLQKIGNLNFWVDSKEYNVVENIHMIWLSTVCDMQAKKEQKHIGVHGRNI